MDETLIHCSEPLQPETIDDVVSEFLRHHCRDPTTQEIVNLLSEVKFQTRPFAYKFIEEMSELFELVIFTAAD